MPEPSFVHLHTHSAYSLAEGAIRVKDLVKLCQKYRMPAAAVTDTGNLFGTMEFATEAAKGGVQPIIGCQIRVGLEAHELVLLVQDEEGYKNLSRIVSDAFLNSDPAGTVHAEWTDLEAYNRGLICLTGGLKGPVSQYLLHNQPKQAKDMLRKLTGIFPQRLYVELQRHGWPEEGRIEERLLDLAYDFDVPIVATNDCYFPKKEMHEAHDALLCIAEGRYVTEADRRRVTPEHYFKSPEVMRALFADLPEAADNTLVIARRCSFLLKPIQPILPPFATEGGRSEIEELREQAVKGLEWRLENFVYPLALSSPSPSLPPSLREGQGEGAQAGSLKHQLLEHPHPNPPPQGEGTSEKEWKEKIAKPYRDRLAFELDVIIQMGFPGYFLIVSDFITWAKDHHIPVGPGRGSGAGSVVAWSLKITDLDPLRFGLLFERFLNPERVSMPDFDVDFCQDRRDEVIRYVQDRYGRDRVAQIITFGKLQARAVVRDVGRVLQMPYGAVDRIAKLIPSNPANPVTLEQALEQDSDLRAEREKDETADKLITIALQLEGLYRHASTHAAGVVIADRPLHELVPLYRDPRSDMPVTQFNMKYVESAGLVKFDFLGLKTMTVIQKTVDLINAKRLSSHPLLSSRSEAEGSAHSRESQDPSASLRDDKKKVGEGDKRQELLDILKIPLDDEKTYRAMAEGRTVGIFQLESSGMRSTLTGMKPNRFEDIIAIGALYRPGPMDNIPTYIAVKQERQAADYMHPLLKPYLEETYGVIVYQEQVMQAAQALSGYTLGGADLLRRAMGKKIPAEMAAQRQIFIDGAVKHNGLAPERASEVFDQIDKFAGYGFNKSHAAAYALITYWTGWLKANYPLEFMAASMTLDLQNTDKLAIFKQELDRMKIRLLPPDVNKSDAEFRVEYASHPSSKLPPAHLWEGGSGREGLLDAGLAAGQAGPPPLAPPPIDGQGGIRGGAIRYALAGLKGVGESAMIRLVGERKAKGDYATLFDLATRVEPGSLNKRQFESLASAGAFDSLNPNRAQAHASAETLLRYAQAQAEERNSGQNSLFGGGTTTLAEPPLAAVPDWDMLERLKHEFDAVGFYLSAHPLDAKSAQLERMKIMTAAQVETMLAHQTSVVADMAGVLLKKQIKVSPKNGNKYAFLQMSDSSGVFEVMLFSEVLHRAKEFLIEGESLLLKAVAEQKNEQTRYSVQDIQPLEKTLASKVREIRLAASKPKGLSQLKTLLAIEGEGQVKITLEIPVGNGVMAEMELPGRWSFSPEARNALIRSGAFEIREY
jgi:DNA polymerase-3 subunit alpha